MKNSMSKDLFSGKVTSKDSSIILETSLLNNSIKIIEIDVEKDESKKYLEGLD